MLSLKTENLLQNYYMEAGLWGPRPNRDDCHGAGNRPPASCAGISWVTGSRRRRYIAANTGDQEIKGKADYIISELARCQEENGGEWAGSIPEKYLDWVARGKQVWAPHYTLHKTLMGLWDMYAVRRQSAGAGDPGALGALVLTAGPGSSPREQMDNILDIETGGMLEVWANLYGVTGEKEHYELIQRYDRRRLFDPLLAGKDVLTNMHMNTTIPEVQGAARAWEVTGEERWRADRRCLLAHGRDRARLLRHRRADQRRDLVAARRAVRRAWAFRTQEHCTVYNMMRLAEYLLRWTGDPAMPITGSATCGTASWRSSTRIPA